MNYDDFLSKIKEGENIKKYLLTIFKPSFVRFLKETNQYKFPHDSVLLLKETIFTKSEKDKDSFDGLDIVDKYILMSFFLYVWDGLQINNLEEAKSESIFIEYKNDCFIGSIFNMSYDLIVGYYDDNGKDLKKFKELYKIWEKLNTQI